MTTTGRVFAASPRSASQTSPGCGLIQTVQDLLLRSPRSHQFQQILVRENDDLRHALSHLSGRLRFPFPQLRIQFFEQRVHDLYLTRYRVGSYFVPTPSRLLNHGIQRRNFKAARERIQVQLIRQQEETVAIGPDLKAKFGCSQQCSNSLLSIGLGIKPFDQAE